MRLGLCRRGTGKGGMIIVFFILLAISVAFFAVLAALKPTFVSYADTYADNIANRIVNDAVNEVFSNEDYSSLSENIGSDENGLKTVSTDTTKINKLKARLNDVIQNDIENFQSETIGIPLGSASGIYFFADLGPKIPIRISPISMVNTDFRDEFDSAGINQVNHRIYLDVSLEMSFVGLTFSQNKNVSTSALLSETVIVGDVPQYYGGAGVGALVE